MVKRWLELVTRPGFDQNSNNNNTKVERPTSFVDLPNSTSSCSELASKKKISGEGGGPAPPSGGRKLGSGGGGGGGGWARLKGGPASSAPPSASEHPPSKEQTTSSGLVTNSQFFPNSIFYNQPGISVFLAFWCFLAASNGLQPTSLVAFFIMDSKQQKKPWWFQKT